MYTVVARTPMYALMVRVYVENQRHQAQDRNVQQGQENPNVQRLTIQQMPKAQMMMLCVR